MGRQPLEDFPRMRSHRALLSAAGLLACLLPSPVKASDGTFADPAHHFTLEAPAGWRLMDADELQRINDALPDFARDQDVRYVAALRPVEDMPHGYPYALVQIVPLKSEDPSWDELEKGLNIGVPKGVSQVKDALGEKAPDLVQPTTTVDRARNRYVTQLSFEKTDAGPVDGLSTGHVGRGQIVLVHTYAVRADFAASQSAFDQLNDSLRWEAGHEFVPGPGRWGSLGEKALIGAIAGAVGALVGQAWRRRKRRRADAGA